ncbi:MAG: M15 family metallopeptidase [Treponema sp.]|nr:M15 family metallopeptidase [Treponema sp.]
MKKIFAFVSFFLFFFSVYSQSREDLKKVDLVLSKMSARAQKELNITDKAQFLKDLGVVLAAEKNYRSDDLNLYYLIDKKHSVSSDYEPKDLVHLVKNDLYAINRNDLSLRPDVEKALSVMAKAALDDGIRLLVSSTYRSYSYQEKLFARWVAIDGLEEAERESARPGTSQHQLGVAIDFGSITDDFDTTPMGQWVYKNAAKFGWSLSFPKNYEDITGYRWECWHFRYIGVPACQMQKKWFCDVQQYMLEFIDLWKQL